MTSRGTELRAVIFDCDGVLVDTETADYEAWRELHQLHGRDLDLESYCHHAGMYGSWQRLYEELAGWIGRPWDELYEWRHPRFLQGVRQRLNLCQSLDRLLRELEEAGIRRAIASSSDADWVEFLVSGLGIGPRFEARATGGEVATRKPAPDLYLLAAERLGVSPGDCVAIEDSSHGVAAARAAGMRVVVLPNLVSSRQDLSGAHAQFAGFSELDLSKLREVALSRE